MEMLVKILIIVLGLLFGVSSTKKVIINQDMEVILCDSEDLEEDSEDSEDDFSNVNEEDLEEDVPTSINN